jgi:hypothetical protein
MVKICETATLIDLAQKILKKKGKLIRPRWTNLKLLRKDPLKEIKGGNWVLISSKTTRVRPIAS